MNKTLPEDEGEGVDLADILSSMAAPFRPDANFSHCLTKLFILLASDLSVILRRVSFTIRPKCVI